MKWLLRNFRKCLETYSDCLWKEKERNLQKLYYKIKTKKRVYTGYRCADAQSRRKESSAFLLRCKLLWILLAVVFDAKILLSMNIKFNKVISSKLFLSISGVIFLSILFRFLRIFDFATFGHDNSRDSIAALKMYEYGEYIYVGPVFSVVWGYMSPIYYYLLYPFYLLFSFNPIAAPVATILANIAALVLIVYASYRFYGKTAAFISAIIFGLSVYVIKQSSEGLNPTLMIPFSILAFYSYVQWLKSSREKLLYIFAFALSFITALHPAGFFVLVPFVILFFFYKPKISIKQFVIASGIYGLLGVLPYLIQEKKLAWWTIKQFIVYFKADKGESLSFVTLALNYIMAVLKNISFTLFNNGSHLGVFVAALILGFMIYEASEFINKRNHSSLLAFTLILYLITFGVVVKFEDSEPHAKWFMAMFIPLLVLYISNLISKIYHINYRYLFTVILCGFLAINLYQFFTLQREPDSNSYVKEVAELIRKDSNGSEIDLYGVNPQPFYYMMWHNETDSTLKEQYFSWIKWTKTKDANRAYFVEVKEPIDQAKIDEIKKNHKLQNHEIIYTSELGMSVYVFK